MEKMSECSAHRLGEAGEGRRLKDLLGNWRGYFCTIEEYMVNLVNSRVINKTKTRKRRFTPIYPQNPDPLALLG